MAALSMNTLAANKVTLTMLVDNSPDTPKMAEVLAKAGELVAPGVPTESIDLQHHEWFIERNAYPSTINYHGYPKASCTSVNEVICHGIPDSRPLQDGDICHFLTSN